VSEDGLSASCPGRQRDAVLDFAESVAIGPNSGAIIGVKEWAFGPEPSEFCDCRGLKPERLVLRERIELAINPEITTGYEIFCNVVATT
jgi:hypothetical protein